MDSKKLMLIALGLGLLVRLSGLFQVAAIDELGYLGLQRWENWHPPLLITLHIGMQTLFGTYVWVSRLLSLLIGAVNIFLTYLISKELFGEEAAQISVAVMSLGAYPILASLQIDSDGSLLLLTYLFTAYMFIRYEKTGLNRWLMLTALGFGLALLTKYSGVFIVLILGAYHLLKNKDLLKSIKIFVPIVFGGLVIFSIFPLLSYISGSNMFKETISHFMQYQSSPGINLTLLMVQYLLAVVWMGPFFILIFLLGVPESKEAGLLPMVWVLIIVCVYSFLNKDNFKPIERYFTVLTAPMAMIIGYKLANMGKKSRYKLGKKSVTILLVGVTIICYVLLMLLGSGSTEILAFYPKSGYLSRAASLDWDFYLPITGSSGPIGFYLVFSRVALGFVLGGILFIAVLAASASKNKRLANIFLFCLIGIGIAYNTMLLSEYSFSATTPSVDRISKEALRYSLDNELEEPVYVFRNKALEFYLDDKYSDLHILDFDIENDAEKVEEVTASTGTVLVVDFPSINRESVFWRELQSCTLKASFSDKGFILGYVFECD